ncbi:hypothetical protein [Haloferax marisrubri]|uniref:Uncharacterized protein n=1 Tax=Haloferax marisrubri TaxID=1544719 RepID=A0A2P4NKZ3_9EURY|nr:hypothetical protein [Haloferax marisrubri]POG53807.1 hypothetical protein AUR65_018715 [Haloferax marisrubri]
MSETDSPEIVRRKFTLTKSLDEQLVSAAAESYGGNVSLFLRQAISDHQKTLDGDGRLALQRLEREVGEVREQAIRISAESKRLNDSIKRLLYQLEQQANGVESFPSLDARIVFDLLVNSEDPLGVEDIIEELGMRPLRVRRALEGLWETHAIQTTDGVSFEVSSGSLGATEDSQ